MGWNYIVTEPEFTGDKEVRASRKPKTNADRIRAMTDEELADFLHEEMMAAIVRGWKSWLDWLKREADHDKR